jgi:hypothetical protein
MASQNLVSNPDRDKRRSSSSTGVSSSSAPTSDAAEADRMDTFEDDIDHLVGTPIAAPPQSLQSHSPVLLNFASLQQRSSHESRSLSFPSMTHTSVEISLTSSISMDNVTLPIPTMPIPPAFIPTHPTNLMGRISSCDGVHPPRLNMRDMGHAFVKELQPGLVQEHNGLSRIMFSNKAFKTV